MAPYVTSTNYKEAAISSDYATLRRVAEALGLPIEVFFAEAPTPMRSASTDECLRLWSEITTEEGRQHALQALQAVVDWERSKQSRSS